MEDAEDFGVVSAVQLAKLGSILDGLFEAGEERRLQLHGETYFVVDSSLIRDLDQVASGLRPAQARGRYKRLKEAGEIP